MSAYHLFLAGQCARCGASLRSALAPQYADDACVQPDAPIRAYDTPQDVAKLHHETEASVCEELHALRSDVAACRLTRAEVERRLGILADSLWQARKIGRAAVRT